MKNEEIEQNLEKGKQLGVRKDTDDLDYLGWILLRKRKPPTIWSKEAYNDEQHYQKQTELAKQINEFPYHIIILELKRDVHERGDYETESDYKMWENHYFSSLSEAEKLFKEFGYKIQNIRFREEIEAP